jgi:glucokinase
MVKDKLAEEPVAISFAFPGPADYASGIIGDLPNFPCFRGGVAMGPYLAESFCIPVFINNDGNLFAYGEALVGALPYVNSLLEKAGSSKRFRNLLGITLGTGFGAGVVIDNVLLTGDNGCGGDVWLMRNSRHSNMIAEESVSIRAVKRHYHERAAEDNRDLSPKDIFEIAEGKAEGNTQAAVEAFQELGTVAADAIANAINIVDGLVVIGGGLAGAGKYIVPSIVKQLNSHLTTFSGAEISCLQMTAYDLTSEEGLAEILKDNSKIIKISKSTKTVRYNNDKKTGVMLSMLGASTAISLGAYVYALRQLDR